MTSRSGQELILPKRRYALAGDLEVKGQVMIWHPPGRCSTRDSWPDHPVNSGPGSVEFDGHSTVTDLIFLPNPYASIAPLSSNCTAFADRIDTIGEQSLA